MSTSIFERITAAAKQRGFEVPNSGEKRYIKRLSELDAELMSKADARALVISKHVRLVRIEFNGETYFSVFGLSTPDQLPPGLESVSLTPGIFAVSVLQAEIQVKAGASAYDIRDALEDQFMGVAGYEGHELSDVSRLFPPAVVYRVTVAESFLESDHRVLGSLLARSYVDGPIHLSVLTIEKIWRLFETGSKFIPYRNLVQGLIAISWDHMFLEIYRCLEQLYSEPRVAALREQWHSSLSLHALAAMLEQHLTWRPKEDESLARLIGGCDAPCVTLLCNAFEYLAPSDVLAEKAEGVSRRVYELRNKVVHYRPIHEAIQKSDAQWDGIVSALLEVVAQVYDMRGDKFFVDLPIAPAPIASMPGQGELA